MFFAPSDRIVVRQRLLREHVERGAGDLYRLSSASISAGSSTTPPRATLTRYAVGFIAANTFALMMLRVSADSGASATRKSSSGATLTRSSRRAMRSKPGVGRGCRADADHRHAERLAVRRQIFGDQSDAENADCLAVQKLAPASGPIRFRPCACVDLRQVAGQRQHVGDRGFRHRRAMNAADIGDEYFLRARAGRQCCRRRCRAPGSISASAHRGPRGRPSAAKSTTGFRVATWDLQIGSVSARL